jgi:Phosphatidylserine/phosphatidylglycerophosphate/cardiolipin synthases and related enzymes
MTEPTSDLPPTPRFHPCEGVPPRALFDGAAYDGMLALLESARRSVRFAMFLFGGPHAAQMTDLLAAKRDAGLDVRVTLDWMGGMLPPVRREGAAALRRLRDLNLDVALADRRPLPGAPTGRATLAHHKFLVVDEQEALVGGTNVGTFFYRHHDVMIRLAGPAAAALAAQFDYDRRFTLEPGLPRPSGAVALPVAESEPVGSGGATGPAVRVVGTGVGRRTTRDAVLENLRTARRSVDVAMCEMGSGPALDELIAAHRRGVAVRVLLDPMDLSAYLPALIPGPLRRVWPKGCLNASARAALGAAGVPVRLYRVGDDFCQMHLKMAVFDGERAVVGSTNWTHGGFTCIGETDLELRGGPEAAVGEMAAQFSRDWEGRSDPAPPPSALSRLLCRTYERLFAAPGNQKP